MISERLERLKTRAREIAAALKAKVVAAVHDFLSASSIVREIVSLINVGSEGNVLDTGKRYRKTSGHAPLFSLFTFFADR